MNKKSGSLAARIPSRVWLLISLVVALIVWTILSVMPLTARSFPNVIVTIQQIGVMYERGVLLTDIGSSL
ncbi:MAG TPA: ABC transporter permease, partial [Subdoligranulum variabile]|nr:ABC transporter permease [Subdoligranulum variabile]